MAVRTVSDSGGNWSSGTTWVGGVVPVNGDEVVFTPTSGNIVVDVSTANLIGINFTNYVGTITFNNNINVFTTINLGTGGYTQAGSFGLNIISSVTGFTSNSVVWSRRLTFTGVNVQTYTLLDNLFVTGDIIFSVGSAHVLNGFNLYIRGNLTLTSSGTIQGTTNFIINGNTTWSSAGSSIRNNLEINTTGSTTISGTVYYAGNTLKYVTANTITTSGSTLSIGNLSGTILETSGMTWDNIIFNGGNPTLVGDLNVNGNLSTNVSGAQILGNFNINVGGNFTLGGQVYGDATIVLNGVGNQTWSGNFDLRLSMTINKPSGNFIVSGSVIFRGNPSGILNYVNADNAITTGSTLNLLLTTTLNTSGITWNNVTMGVSTTQSNVTLDSDLYMSGNLLTQGTQVKTINGVGRRVYVGGNITINSTTSGSATIELNGSNNQTWSSAAYLGNSLTINKITGNLNLSSNVYYQSGSLVYSAGTVITTGTTLNIGSSCTLSTNGITWDNFTVNVGTIQLTLTNNLNITGTTSFTGVNGPLTVTFPSTGLFNPTGSLSFGSTNIVGSGTATITVTLPNDIFVTSIFISGGILQTGAHWRNVTLNGSKTIHISGGLTNGLFLSNTAFFTGNCTLKFTGSGAISFSNNPGTTSIPLEIAASGNYTFSGVISFSNTTITYTSGTVSGVQCIFTNCTLNLNAGGQWGTDVVLVNNTALISNATFGNLTTSTTTVNFTGAFTINIKGNLSVNITTNGVNTPIIFNGTGNQSWTTTGFFLGNNLTIDKSSGGTMTIGSVSSPTVYYQTGVLKYITASTINTSASTLWLSSCILETSGMTWGNVTTNSSTVNLRLNETFNVGGTFLVYGGNATLTFTGGTGIFNPMGEFNLGDANTVAGVTTKNITLPNDITVSSFFVHQIQGLSNYRNVVLNGGKRINITGNITMSSGSSGAAGGISGNCTLGLIGGGNYIQGGGSGGVSMSLPVVVDTIGTYNFQFFPSFQSSVNYIQGTITGATTYFTNTTLNFNAGLKWGTSAILGGNTTLQTNVTFGNLTTQTTNVVFSGTSNVNVEGNLAINITTSNAVGSTNTILLNGTSFQSWTSTGFYLSTPLTIDKSSGVLTIGSVSLPNVYYQTGTLRHLLGTVDTSTTLSVLNLGSNPILSTSGITWYNIANIATSTTSLLNDFIWSNNWSIGNAYTITFSGSSGNLAPLPTANIVFNGGPSVTLKNNIQITNATLGIATINTNQISLSGNLSVTGSVGGTTNILFNGSGAQSWEHPSASYISNNITINKPGGVLTLGSNIYYNTNTLTRTAGNVNTTTNNTTLNINASCTLATQGITWNAINWVGGTITLSNPLTAIGVITVTHSFPGLNGSDLYANGGMNYTALNLSTNFAYMSGNATIRFEGTGSWNSSRQGTYQNNVIINPTGNFSINVYYALGTITYDSTNGGNVTSAYVTLGYYTALSGRGLTRSTTFNTNSMKWDYILCMSYTDSGGGTTSNITCLSNLNSDYLGFTGIGVVAGDVWNFIMSGDANLTNIGNFNLDARCTVNLAKNFTTKILSFSTGIFQRLNNGIVTVTNLLTSSSSQGAINITGTSKLILGNNSSWQRGDNNTALFFNMEFKGNIKFGTSSFPTMFFYGSSIEYTGYNSSLPKATGTLYIATNATLTNFNRLPFSNLIIGAGLTLTMNEFFSGYNNFKCNVSSSSSANYTVNLTNSYEKTVKFLNIRNCTLSRKGQVLVTTDSKRSSTNVGFRYINNISNGLPKNEANFINNQLYGISETYLLQDPSFIKTV